MIMMKREITKREIHIAIAHHLLADAQAVPEKWMAFPGQFPSAYILDIMFYGVEYLFGQFGSAALAMMSSNFFLHLLTVWARETEKKFRARTAQQHL